jgi:DNA replication protein DnaC
MARTPRPTAKCVLPLWKAFHNGKTHLAIANGMKAATVQKRVLFFTAEKLIEELQATEVSGKLPSFMDLMGRVDLLIIDELGYLKLTRQSAELFFN